MLFTFRGHVDSQYFDITVDKLEFILYPNRYQLANDQLNHLLSDMVLIKQVTASRTQPDRATLLIPVEHNPIHVNQHNEATLALLCARTGIMKQNHQATSQTMRNIKTMVGISVKKESDNDAEAWAYTISQKNAPLGSVQSAMNSPSKAWPVIDVEYDIVVCSQKSIS